MSEDNQWRQLGSIVNAVLLDARSKAIRSGAVSKPAASPSSRKTVQAAASFPQPATGNGFLSDRAQASPRPVQLELPFGIAGASQTGFGAVRFPRGARLM
ncbi:MAG: hypothetical protein HY765_00940 [Rhodomicrobium sp.]|nr:hypothetical protein [Rhodomicrobium sp.]